jgi:KUP system potassium uptake protein
MFTSIAGTAHSMSRNAGRAVDYFGIPSNAVIELGTRVQL